MEVHLYPHIVATSEVLSGQPIIEGTRVPVSTLVADVAAGKSLEKVARMHGVSVDAVRAALEYAAKRAGEPVAVSAEEGSAISEQQGVADAVATQAQALGLDAAQISPLGRRLLELREQIVAAGVPLISSWEELEAEVADLRGERVPDEA